MIQHDIGLHDVRDLENAPYTRSSGRRAPLTHPRGAKKRILGGFPLKSQFFRKNGGGVKMSRPTPKIFPHVNFLQVYMRKPREVKIRGPFGPNRDIFYGHRKKSFFLHFQKMRSKNRASPLIIFLYFFFLCARQRARNFFWGALFR